MGDEDYTPSGMYTPSVHRLLMNRQLQLRSRSPLSETAMGLRTDTYCTALYMVGRPPQSHLVGPCLAQLGRPRSRRLNYTSLLVWPCAPVFICYGGRDLLMTGVDVRLRASITIGTEPAKYICGRERRNEREGSGRAARREHSAGARTVWSHKCCFLCWTLVDVAFMK